MAWSWTKHNKPKLERLVPVVNEILTLLASHELNTADATRILEAVTEKVNNHAEFVRASAKVPPGLEVIVPVFD